MAHEFLRKYGKDGGKEGSGFSSKVQLGLNKKTMTTNVKENNKKAWA